MNKIIVVRQGQALTIRAPEGKAMAIDQGHLAHGILSINEYGPSGIKVAAFSDWNEVIFDCEGQGYTLTEENPF